ncbi:MAG TPA: hypothetical protein VK901_20425, partial [Nitrospiraceae bacterium]|nr:hypothetical protein [Nitrospiraceae bacterium]
NGFPSACYEITCPFLLESYDHAVRSGQTLYTRTLEPDVFHPLAAICASEVESAVGFNEHVQAHKQPERILLARVVNERFMHDQCAVCR